MVMRSLFVFVLFAFFCNCPLLSGHSAVENYRVWGPGLNPHLVFPVRYFFAQRIGTDGQELNDSIETGELKFKIEPLRGLCRVHYELLDRKDGLGLEVQGQGRLDRRRF